MTDGVLPKDRSLTTLFQGKLTCEAISILFNQHLKENNMSVRDAVRALGYSKSSIQRIKAGKCGLEQGIQILEKCGYQFETIVTFDPTPVNAPTGQDEPK